MISIRSGAAGYIRATVSDDELHDITHRAAAFVASTATPDRTDRLWAADYMVFLTTPVSYAYGAGGTALFLHDVGALPESAEEWLLDQDPGIESCSPSLYVGLAGLAYTLAELGQLERARAIFDRVRASPLRFADPTVFNGAAGWGTVALVLHSHTGESVFLADAKAAGDYILSAALRDSHGLYWKSDDARPTSLGYAYGASGIALFLLHLWIATTDARYLAAARDALAFDVHHGKTIDDSIVWGGDIEQAGHSPYWLRGTSGVASVLVRFYERLGDPAYRELAERAGRGAFALFTPTPAQFEGASGMGELMIDLFRITGDPDHLERAKQLAESALCFRIERPAGIAFPGRGLARLSTDFATGSAGVGAFLHRLATLGPRRLHDVYPRPALHAN